MKQLEEKIEALSEEVEKIKARNKRVEADKAWEISKTRTAFIAVSTYILIVVTMVLIHDNHPFLNAFLATITYLISTSTYDLLKKRWLRQRTS